MKRNKTKAGTIMSTEWKAKLEIYQLEVFQGLKV